MATGLDKALTMLRAPANSALFALRRTLRWRRGAPVMVGQDQGGLFDYLGAADAAAAAERHQALDDCYDLGALRAASGRADYRDNLSLLASLEDLFAAGEIELPRQLRAVDVGAKNWSYVYGLERFLRYWRQPAGRQVELAGVEIDGYGIYRDFRSRCDHALAYVAQTGNPRVEYRVQDFLEFAASDLDVVTIFYPFLTRYALLQWGLPLACYQPRRLLEHAVAMLAPRGVLVVFNQTAAERDLLHGLLAELGVIVVACEPLATKLVDYHPRTEDRWGTLVTP